MSRAYHIEVAYNNKKDFLGYVTVTFYRGGYRHRIAQFFNEDDFVAINRAKNWISSFFGIGVINKVNVVRMVL